MKKTASISGSKKLTRSKEELLALRKKIKSYKPNFIRHDGHKKMRLEKVWRKPRGLHNKVREHRRGYVRNLTPGYGSPLGVKGLHPSGLRSVLITHVSQLKDLDKVNDGLMVSAQMGARKKLLVLQEAQKLQLKVLNLDPVKYKTAIEQKRKDHQELKKQLEEKKKQSEKALEKKAEAKKVEDKKSTAESVDVDEKKEQERREAEKVIIHKK